MHYANGRAAKNGDKVVLIQQYEGKVYASTIGILYDAIPYNDTCNGRLAVISPSDPTPNLKECLHLDDVLAALPKDISNVPQAQAAPPGASDAGESAGSTSGESSGSSASGGSSAAASSASGSGTPESSSSSTSSGSAAGGTSSASSTSGAS